MEVRSVPPVLQGMNEVSSAVQLRFDILIPRQFQMMSKPGYGIWLVAA